MTEMTAGKAIATLIVTSATANLDRLDEQINDAATAIATYATPAPGETAPDHARIDVVRAYAELLGQLDIERTAQADLITRYTQHL